MSPPPDRRRRSLTRLPDGAQVRWTAEGRGRPALLLCDGLGCDGFIWKYLQPALARDHRVVHWHYPAHGESPPPVDPRSFSIANFADGAVAVLDAARVERAVVIGHSMGVQVALEAHRRHPARVEGLILVCGSPGHPLDTFHDTSLLRHLLPLLRRTTDALPRAVAALASGLVRSGIALELALLLEVNPQLVHREDLVPYFAHLQSMDPRLFLRTMEAASEHSAEDHLPAVDVPTLVIGGDRDRFTPPWLSRRMALSIPAADGVMIPGGSHTTPLEAPDRVERVVADFLRRRVTHAHTRATPA